MKRYFRIDQHFARHFVNYGACLSSSPLFLCSQTVTLFCNSMISTNQETGLEFQSIVEFLYPYSCSILEFLLLYQIKEISDHQNITLVIFYYMISSQQISIDIYDISVVDILPKYNEQHIFIEFLKIEGEKYFFLILI